MKTGRKLTRQLESIDRRGYPAYKSLRGVWRLDGFDLSIDHVQGDPFAAPSKVSVWVPAERVGIPPELFDMPHRRIALEDFLVRRFSSEAAKVSFAAGGSGKSGLVATSRPGPEVLPRSACEVGPDGVIVRLEIGFPAHGRTVDARALARILFELLPRCIERAIVCDEAALRAARQAVELADDQCEVRCQLKERDLVAFVADGSILPRASGVSSRPLSGARPFAAPSELRVVLDLPHRGPTAGMGIPRGVTLIVGGGYHGKSTLLKALQEGVYDHVAGDGRELVITDATAMKLRAEDGRAVRSVDISPFIDNLPDGRDTASFSTEDASGSTSQAASTVEALEAGACVLLIDEDTSATNFMVRDRLMEEVVAADHEPITPFVERVRGLWEDAGVSTVLVVGSSGAFFPAADVVIQMDRYEAHDITERVRAVCREHGLDVERHVAGIEPAPPRALVLPVGKRDHGRRGARGAARGRGDDRIKVRTRGLEGFEVGGGSVDMRQVEQLIDAEQTAALAQMVRLVLQHGQASGSRKICDVVDDIYDLLDDQGWEALAERGEVACGLALPRPQELFAALNRWRG